jgi:rapamycin-insensitive companion of mTOR
MTFQSDLANQTESTESLEAFRKAATDPDPINAKILNSIIDMGNTVLYKKAAADLHVTKAKHYEHFHQVTLFQKTLTILESHHFRLPQRQYILDLFDKAVMRHVVLEEDTEEETESDTG